MWLLLKRKDNQQRPTLNWLRMELVDKNFKAAIITMLDDVKENMLTMNDMKI